MPENSERRLAFYEVEALMRSTTASEPKSNSAKSWLTPNDAKVLLTALDHDADSVYVISQGRMFNIKYKDDKVWLYPADGKFVPCGWYTPYTLRKQLREAHVVIAT